MTKARVAFSTVLVAALALSTPALARPFSQLVAFSGSLSDTGNYASVFGPLPPPFYENRSSNGPVAIDVLASRFGLSSAPSLHLVGAPVGTNFATLGALAHGDSPIDLPAQLEAYLGPRGYVADPDALYFVFIGGNDVILAAVEPDDREADRIIRNAVAGIERAIHVLVGAGARTIFAPNFVDLGLAPAARDGGIAERASRMSRSFNRRFDDMLDRVERRLRFELVRWDFERFVNDALRHADELRFTNTTDSCLALLPSGGCDFDHFVFFNEIFPTARVHELVGSALAQALIERDGPGRRKHRPAPHRGR